MGGTGQLPSPVEPGSMNAYGSQGCRSRAGLAAAATVSVRLCVGGFGRRPGTELDHHVAIRQWVDPTEVRRLGFTSDAPAGSFALLHPGIEVVDLEPNEVQPFAPRVSCP